MKILTYLIIFPLLLLGTITLIQQIPGYPMGNKELRMVFGALAVLMCLGICKYILKPENPHQ